MLTGMAIPLALGAFCGVALGATASSGMLEVAGMAGLLLVVRHPRGWPALAMLMAVAVSLLLARGAELPAGLAGEDLTLEGRVRDVSQEAALTRMTVDVEHCAALAERRRSCGSLRRVRLSMREAPPIHAGERWSFTVRLRPPAGLANPDTFDYRAWLWREGIQATGYVRAEPPVRHLAAADVSLNRLALAYLDDQALEPRHLRWLAALTLGASERLERDDWDLLNASGTTHLMVISGLHVGLAATFSLLLGRGVARLLTPHGWRLAVWPWWLAGVATVGYAALAGLEPPAMRAMLMTLVGLWVASGRHAPGPWQGWWLALALVLATDPRSAWQPGLWLSFTAVALLILIWQGRSRPAGARGWCWALLRTQALLAPLMAAAVLLFFARLAPAAPLVNLVAVPLVSTLLVPLGLLGWLLAPLPWLSGLCWWLFGQLAEGLIALLELAVAWLPLWLPEAGQVAPLALSLGALAMLWALPGLALALRAAGSLIVLLVPLLHATPGMLPGELRVRIHDVGQGQLVELRTAGYRLLFDTGPRFGSGFTPLETLWPPGQRFDEVILSHDDLDHAGGVDSLIERHRVTRFLAPEGETIGVDASTCRAGQAWQRDGVSFRILWPPADTSPFSSNDRSCVLEVTTGHQRVLITGDVGRQVERRLLLEASAPVTLLVAGHHGSATSSGPHFISLLAPRQVVYSAGRGNPFGHPADDVVRRFRRAGSCQWSTALDGAVTFWFGNANAPHLHTQRSLPWRRGGVGDDCLALESSD